MANGYRFDFSNGKLQIKKTGMIITSSRPTESEIFIDNKYSKKKTGFTFLPIKIDNILPGTHNVKLKKDGFRTWEGNIIVKPNLVTWLNYILLFPKELKIIEVNNLANKNIIASSRNHRYLLVSGKEEGVSTIYVYDENNENLTKVWPKTLVPVEEWLKQPEIISADFNQGNDKVLINVKTQTGTDWSILELNNTEGKITSLSNLTIPVAKLQWNLTNSNELFVQSGQNLYRVNANTLTFAEPIATKVVDFTSEKNGRVYFVQEEAGIKSLYQMSTDGTRKELVYKSLANDTKYKILYSEKLDGVAVLPQTEKTLRVIYRVDNKITSTELSRDISDFAWSADGDKIYYYNENQIKRFDWEEDVETVVSSGVKIKKVDWYFDEYHYLVQTEKELFEVDYDNSNKVVISGTPVMAVYPDSKLSSFIFVRNDQDKLNFYKYVSSF